MIEFMTTIQTVAIAVLCFGTAYVVLTGVRDIAKGVYAFIKEKL